MRTTWFSRESGRLRWRRLSPALTGLLLIGFTVGCGVAYAAGTNVAAPAEAPVITITNFTYTGSLTVEAGATVTVRNADTAPHTLTAVDGSFTTPTINAGQSATFTAPKRVGSFAIKCNIHSSMSGTLTVVAVAPSPTPTASPTPIPNPGDPPANAVITISNFTYTGDLRVRAGATVTVRNADTAPHTLTAVDGSFTTPVIQPGGSATFVAPAVGKVYAIMCNIHASMSGSITVVTPLTANPVITISNFEFTGDLAARPGSTATIRNADTVPHTFTAVDGSFTTPTINPGTSVRLRLPSAVGSYAVKCNIHSFMMGTISIRTA